MPKERFVESLDMSFEEGVHHLAKSAIGTHRTKSGKVKKGQPDSPTGSPEA